MSELTFGIIIGVASSAAIYMLVKGNEWLNRVGTFDSEEPMTHDLLLSFVSQEYPYIDLRLCQARQLLNDYDQLDEHLADAMTRNAELFTELEKVKAVANRNALEAAHCRAVCDELRAKLDAKVGA